MKILMLVNWKVEYCNENPADKQPPDYFVKDEDYWFYRYFDEKPQVDVIDISSFPWLERFEKNKLRFYIWQALKAIPRMGSYDVVVSHGMQSGIVVALWRRIRGYRSDSTRAKGKTLKHIVFDIGAFNSGKKTGRALKLMQFASRSIDGIIYHTKCQEEYYEECFPWLADKAKYIQFGTDAEFFADGSDLATSDDAKQASEDTKRDSDDAKLASGDGRELTTEETSNLGAKTETGKSAVKNTTGKKDYILCVGYDKRDWKTLVQAYVESRCTAPAAKFPDLYLVGKVSPEYESIEGVVQKEFVPIKELVVYISDALFCVVPLWSLPYSYGQMTLLQQMALGKAVIAADVPSLSDYGTDGQNILFYKPEDVDDLSDKIGQLVGDSVKRDCLGTAARYYVENECNEKLMAREVEEFYNSICGK